MSQCGRKLIKFFNKDQLCSMYQCLKPLNWSNIYVVLLSIIWSFHLMLLPFINQGINKSDIHFIYSNIKTLLLNFRVSTYICIYNNSSYNKNVSQNHLGTLLCLDGIHSIHVGFPSNIILETLLIRDKSELTENIFFSGEVWDNLFWRSTNMVKLGQIRLRFYSNCKRF